MTKFQKAFCILLSLCFCCSGSNAGALYLRGNVYRQLPLYCFLEEEARSTSEEDPETLNQIIESNADYLGERVQRENTEGAVQEENEAVREKEAESAKEQEKTKEAAPTEAPGPTENRFRQKCRSRRKRRSRQRRQSGRKRRSRQRRRSRRKRRSRQRHPEPGMCSLLPLQIQPHPVVDLSPEMLADYDYLLGQFLF